MEKAKSRHCEPLNAASCVEHLPAMRIPISGRHFASLAMSVLSSMQKRERLSRLLQIDLQKSIGSSSLSQIDIANSLFLLYFCRAMPEKAPGKKWLRITSTSACGSRGGPT